MEIPRELRRTLPRLAQEMADRRVVWFFGIFVLLPVLYAAAQFPYGWERIIPPAAGPLVAALFLTVRPWNPYASYAASRAGITSETVKDDPAAQRLLGLLRSREARKTIWETAVFASILFSVIAAAISRLVGPPKSWDVSFVSIGGGILLCGILSLCLFYHRLLRWAVRGVANAE